MHRLVLGNPFEALVALILLSGLAFRLLNKWRARANRNAEDPNPGAPSPSIRPMRSHYEVFLSFRGPDTRRGFTDHLYIRLVNAGIRVSRDDDELRVGESINALVLEAIKNCKILIPIISENYASSQWCLRELVHMMDCKKRLGRTVLPIFYKVEPADVERLTGSFGEVFGYYHSQRNFDQKLVEEWKQALREVCSIAGFVSEKHYGREGQLVEWIVHRVLNELKEAVKFNLVGMESHVEEIMKLLNKSSGATLYVGIHGIGGIGKTTLAKVIYNKLSNLFEHRSFIANVRESCQCNGIEYLQNQLICDILDERIQLYNKYEGINFISSKFKDKKVLIYLDDVDETSPLEALAGNHNWFASGSRIIVTTRDRSVLARAGVDIEYKLEGMSEEQSLILFSKHAFRRDSPPRDFETLSRHVVSMTGGLPLHLETIGSLLCGKGLEAWIKTIENMQILPRSDLQDKLMISYDLLEGDQKEIFLDIACFLSGSDARVASYMWDACGFYTMVGIEVLISLSFIKIGDNHELLMHDQLRDLGREIVCQESTSEFCRSRLWNYEEAFEVLNRNEGTEKIKAIHLEKGKMTRIADEDDSDHLKDQGSHTFKSEQFKNLSKLRFLHMSDVNLTGDFKGIFSELRWLKWGNCSPTFEAMNFHPKELAILDLSRSLISDHWQGWNSMMMAEKLKVLNLTGCCSLKSTFFLSAFQCLEILILRYCGELEQIDSFIGDVKALVSLDLRGCSCLEELPPQMGKLEGLKELFLDQTKIKAIPSSIGSLKKLETLSAKDCKSLLELPHSIGHLVNLRCLLLGHCHQLREIPNSIGQLKLLTQLDLSWTRIRKLPESLGDLQNLKALDIHHSSIEKLPDGIRERLKSSEIYMPDGA